MGEKEMELGLALVLCGLGGAFWITAGILTGIGRRKKKKCTMDATGIVIRINTRNSRENGLEFHPVYEYYAAGDYHTGEGAYISGKVPEVGADVHVKYDPDRPDRSYIDGYDNKALKILSIVFWIIGSVPVLVCVGIAVYCRL